MGSGPNWTGIWCYDLDLEVDSSRWGRASGSGGTAGPMEEVKRDKTEMRVVGKVEKACRIQFLLFERRGFKAHLYLSAASSFVPTNRLMS